MKIAFVQNDRLEEYHGLADFHTFGETQDIDEDIARTLKSKFPKAFQIFELDGSEIENVEREPAVPEYTGPKTKLKFIAGSGPGSLGTEYHGQLGDVAVSFIESGQVQEIPTDIADTLLAKFPKNFADVEELAPESGEDRCQWLTVRGTKCKRVPLEGEPYCAQHLDMATGEDKALEAI